MLEVEEVGNDTPEEDDDGPKEVVCKRESGSGEAPGKMV